MDPDRPSWRCGFLNATARIEVDYGPLPAILEIGTRQRKSPETISVSGGAYGEIHVFRLGQAAARCGIFRIVGSAP